MAQRSKFTPEPCGAAHVERLSMEGEENEHAWVPLIHCLAGFPAELFEVAIANLVHHPEYNSTLILRSETVAESDVNIPLAVPRLRGFVPLRTIHRRLLPRRPGRDVGIEQYCTLYFSQTVSGAERLPTLLVLTPIVEPGSSLPYYHPAVSHLAFRYIRSLGGTDDHRLQIEALPLDGVPTDVSSRLYRTSLALLDTLHRYGFGAATQYKKRVLHDRIVPREGYQDLYLVLRERHKHLVDTWQESTDPLKHVFEDIGIATFLMLLWKDMYATPTNEADRLAHSEGDSERPWVFWPRPPQGFVDLGCGNGLLTHILAAEGYAGRGVDVRARTSWAHYPESTQACLHVEALDPTKLLDGDCHPYLVPGAFLIGNHADELTPWVPVLATLCNASGYLSIPCCSWTFDTKFERSKHAFYPMLSPLEEFADALYLGGDGNIASSYSQYRIWLASLTLHCGWKVESESLRIPSTRNWALIGRERVHPPSEDDRTARDNAESIVRHVRERGIFKTRRPEGKAGDH